jgi:hypothetical protein
MPELIMKTEDAERLYKSLLETKKALGYIPSALLNESVLQISKARKAAKLRFFELLSQGDEELLKSFWTRWKELLDT